MSKRLASDWRSPAKDRVIVAMQQAALLRYARREVARQGVLVLTLHRIVADANYAAVRSPRGMVLRESHFRKLLEYLTLRADCLTLPAAAEKRSNATKPRVLLTFDDGWADNAEIAWPLLQAAGVPITIFVTTGLAGRKFPFWPERLIGVLRCAASAGALTGVHERMNSLQHTEHIRLSAPLASPPSLTALTQDFDLAVEWAKRIPQADFETWLEETEAWIAALTPDQAVKTSADASENLLTWEQMRQLQASGVLFGSHTVHHTILTQCSSPVIAKELEQSREQITRELGPTDAVSYPNGSADSRVISTARRAGYRLGFLNCAGIWGAATNPFSIPRVNLWDGKMTDSHGNFSAAHLEYSIFWKALRAR